ncbi:MAG: metallophosphoesterase family protein [Victivallales bacterium]|nr:metallophosphoesterase family protein [Victivallales bacterium]
MTKNFLGVLCRIMRLGIISDVHSNYEALQATYRELCRRGCEKIICLGDVVGYGPSPNECIDFFVEKNIESIKGNHDYYVNCVEKSVEELGVTPNAFRSVEWTREALAPSHKEWLDNLPFTLTRWDMMFIHAAVDTAEGEYWPYIFDIHSAMFHFYFQTTMLAFFGHVHVPLMFSCQKENNCPRPAIRIEKLKEHCFAEETERKFLINPGSVGQPRNRDNRSSSLVLDLETCTLEAIYVQYDFQLTCRKILKSDLPEELALRLISGT